MSHKKPVNVAVYLQPGESQENLLKRFMKKYRKSEIAREYLEKTSFYLTKTQKRKEKIRKNKWLKQKCSQKSCKITAF